MTDRDALRRELDAQIAECRRMLTLSRAQLALTRARLGIDDNDEGAAAVRVPSPRGPAPRLDATHAPPPAPHYYLDVVGDCGGKVTIETLR
jgi:hypothetical protein